MATYWTTNFTSLVVGIILSVVLIILIIITINTSLSIVDSKNCFRYGIITKQGYFCSLIKKEFRELVQMYCPEQFNLLLKEDKCKGDPKIEE